jgi:hypothetical protein
MNAEKQRKGTNMEDPKSTPRPDSELTKGAVEFDRLRGHTPVSLSGQLPHRTEDELIKDSDSDFPEPGGNPEHTGEPESKPRSRLEG